MSITIELSQETKTKMREYAAAHGARLEEYLRLVLQFWATETASAKNGASSTGDKTPQQRVADWLAFVASHEYVTAIADDSRESIYGVEPAIPPESKTQDQWESEWRAWAASHKPAGVFVDDSRESIYAGRRE